jgi:hypothetical protein
VRPHHPLRTTPIMSEHDVAMSRVLGLLGAGLFVWLAALPPTDPFVFVLLGGGLAVIAIMFFAWAVAPHRVHASMQAGEMRAHTRTYERDERRALDAEWHARHDRSPAARPVGAPEHDAQAKWREGY